MTAVDAHRQVLRDLENEWRYSPDRLGVKLAPELRQLVGTDYIRARHVQYIGAQIAQAVARGRGRLILNVAPQRGKSTIVSLLTPAWLLHLDPSTRILLGSYEASYAESWGRRVRDLMVMAEPLLGVHIRPDVFTANSWETDRGGGMATSGVGGTGTGKTANIVIIDDPHKSLIDARSPARSREVWDWFTGVMRTRLAPGGTLIIVQTRWTPHDLTGRVMEASDAGTGERYTHIRLPEIAEPTDDQPDPLGRPAIDHDTWEAIRFMTDDEIAALPADTTCALERSLLFPQRYNLVEVAGQRLAQTALGWAGLYQQRPTVAEGDVFKRSDWRRANELPALPVVNRTSPRRGLLMMRSWDLAATRKTMGSDPDFTVGALCALDETTNTFYVVDIVRGQWASGDVRRIIQSTAENDAFVWGAGDRSVVNILGEREGGSSGKTVGEDWEATLAGYPVHWVPSSGSKDLRADPLAASQQNGRVFLVRAEAPDATYGPAKWWDDFIQEAADFGGGGGHDDQIDAVSAAFNGLVEMARSRRHRKVTVTRVAGQSIGFR